MIAIDIKQTLTGFGYDVPSVVASGERAVEEAAKDRPDLVLMDIKMPGGMDGIEAAERIRAQYDIPIVYLTAHSDAHLVDRSKSTEPYGYLMKPFREDDLRTTIEVALYKRDMERALKETTGRLERANDELTREIAERVQAEEEASYERDLLHTLLNQTPDYVYFKDRDRRFVRASNAFCDLFECGLEDIIGKTDEDLFP